jgi:hypothetical protein
LSHAFGNQQEIWGSEKFGGAQIFDWLDQPMVRTKTDKLPCPVPNLPYWFDQHFVPVRI